MSPGMKVVLLLAEILTVGSALLVAFHPNILRAAVALLFSFLGIAVMFLYAGADFIAGAQVVIYVGGITILILFAIMLTRWLYQMKLRDVRTKLLVPILLVGVAFVPLLNRALDQMTRIAESSGAGNLAEFAAAPKTALIGEALLNQYLLPFEGITVLLLGALVGAVWVARPQ